MAYKPSKYILSEINDTVEVIGIMKSIFNFKDASVKVKRKTDSKNR